MADPMHFTIAHAHPDDVERICAIARAAVELFRGHVARSAYAAAPFPPAVVHRPEGRRVGNARSSRWSPSL